MYCRLAAARTWWSGLAFRCRSHVVWPVWALAVDAITPDRLSRLSLPRRAAVVMTLAVLVLIGSGTVYADNSVLILPLTWVGRSTETSASVPFSDVLGGAVDAGLALALDPNETVFDNGIYTSDANKEATPVGNEWASWPQWHGFCGQTFEVRHLRATFHLPTGIGDVHDLILFSPFYTAHGDIIPINDNVYVFLNGTFIGQKGTSYGASNGGFGGKAPFANETDGWFQDGRFGAAAAAALQPGLNTLDLVAEEWCGEVDNGIGRLDLRLVTGPGQLVNDLVAFEPLPATFTFSEDPTGCPTDFVGTFSFVAQLTNVSQDILTELIAQVITLTNGNLLQNADGGPGGVGAELTVPQVDGFGDGVLSPEEFVDVPFMICLTERRPFTFMVDVLGAVE
jgi:hypothetical protein